MEGGAVPPPRKSAPRSLLGPPPTSTASSRYVQGQPKLFTSNEPNEDVQELKQALKVERLERERTQNLLREEVIKLERSMRAQSQLEEELVSKDATIENLSNELRMLKVKKQAADSELAECTADYMNSQAKWIEQVDSLNDEIQALKIKLIQRQEELNSTQQELQVYHEKEAKAEAERRRQEYKASRPDNVQVAADQLEKHQNSLLIKELRAYHAKLKEEIQEIQEINNRLKEDNEHYQYLLVEHTIMGDLSSGEQRIPSDSLQSEQSSGQSSGCGLTLADDEVLYDLKPSNQEPSLADEDSITSIDSTECLKKTVHRQQFELRSLQNHNRALKVSLERLVDRLLDNKSFSQAVEESVSKNSVGQFRKRVASYAEGSKQNVPLSTSGSASPTLSNPSNSAIWSNMIFNSQYTGQPNRRVFSMGVDDEIKPPPPPVSLRTSNPTSDSTSTYKLNPMRYAFGHPKRVSPVASIPDIAHNGNSEIKVAKRTDSLTGMRKLRLAE